MIIDPPSPFAPLTEWVAFFEEMKRLIARKPNDPVVREHYELAANQVSR